MRRSPIPFVVGLGLLVMAAVVYSLFTGARMARRYVPLVDAVMEIKFEAAIGHLWVEEVINGDRNEDFDAALEYIDRSAWYARAMLAGGEAPEGIIIPLRDPDLRLEIEEVLTKIEEFHSIAEKRWAEKAQSGTGSDIDQRFDRVFEDLLMQANDVKIELQGVMARGLFWFRVVQSLLIALCLGLSVLIGVVFRRYERRKMFDISAIQKSETNLSITLDSIGDAVIVTDSKGCVTRMNPVAVALTGWADADARGRSLNEVFHIINSITREEVETPMARVLREGVVVGLANHTALIALDGTERQIADSGAPIRDADGKVVGVVLVFRDVSKVYTKDKQLRESEEEIKVAKEFAESLIETANTLIITLDSEACIRTFNKCAEELTGYNKTEVMGKNWFDLFIPRRDRESLPEVFKDVLELMPEASRHENPILTKKGEERLISWNNNILRDSSGNIYAVLSIGIDITEHRRVESERERLMHAIEQVKESIVITDAEGTIQYINPIFEQVTGYSSEEVIGQNPHVLKSGKHNDAFYSDMWEMLASGKTWHGRLVNKKKDGSLFTEDATISPVRDDSGKTINYVAVKRDITDHIRLEQQYQQAQRVESIGRLAGGVAHDLNNLLTPILGYGEILLADLGPDEARRESVDEILSAGFRARDLVRQLLAFSRKQTLEYKPLDINKVIKNFKKLVRRSVPEDINIEIIPSPDIQTVMADIGQVEQVIMNMAVNAADAMPGGGLLTIETAAVELDESYVAEHQGMAPGAYVMLAISDTGTGMDDEILNQVFEPFFSTKGEQGTGLGLATVYGIIKQHGGNIWVYSEPGEGSTFKVYLPVSEGEHIEVKTSKKNLVDVKGSETILLVEDNEQVRNLTHAILKRQGYEVLVAKNGAEALAVQASHGESVHLLLTDVVMPEMNGKELFTGMIEKHPDMKVLYMSGYTENVIANRGVLEEGIAFIQKPFTIQAMAAKIREVLEQE
ncbi:MAG: PAS domain S-box protein [Bacteroidales bacterium]|nr:PAS domain S-box protein [Candidatus Latescibacterota bacterium]